MSSNCIKPDQLPVVVLRSNDNCFLDILRCCGIENIPVIPVIYNWGRTTPWLSEKSVFYKNPIEIASPDENEPLAANQLAELGKNLFSEYKRKILIIPSSDTTLLFLQRNFTCFAECFLMMGHNNFHTASLDVMSKYEFFKVMYKNKIPTPTTLLCATTSQIEHCVNNITYPCIYKPINKDLTNSFPSKHHGLKAIINFNSNELRKNITHDLANGYRTVVQNFIETLDVNDEVSAYIYIGKNRIVKQTSAQITIKRHPDIFGTGYLSKYVNNIELANLSEKIALALNWRGFLNIEFKFDNLDKKWKVIETNYRPWVSIFFQAAAGHNYIKYLYNDAYELSEETNNKTRLNFKDDLYRVNLAVLIETLIENSTTEKDFKNKFKKWFKLHSGNYVFSTYHEFDKAPALFELEILREKHPKHLSAISDKLNLLLSI